MKKVNVWYSIQNGGDGSAYPSWFLTQEAADRDQEDMDEGWGESCIGMVETYEDSNIHKEAVANAKKDEGKHEYLKAEEFYETRSIGAGRSAKTCEHCGKTIPKGTPHDTNHFYPEFEAYPTHKKCTEPFIKSLR